VNVPVQLDTGSTDLWVYGAQFPGVLTQAQNYTDVSLNLTYGLGSVLGPVSIIDIEFADIPVKSQALLNAVNTLDEDTLFGLGAYGILGLGADSLSVINVAMTQKYKDTRGRSVLSNIFAQDPSEPNHIAFYLGRIGDLDDSSDGTFSVGSFNPKYSAVQNMPVLPVFDPNAAGGARWSTTIDGIEFGGHNVTFPKSTVSKAPSNKLIALLDTGASAMYIPNELATALYNTIEGAIFLSTENVWLVPCLSEIEIALWIQGQRYPIHPLDVTQPIVAQLFSLPNATYCLMEVQPMDASFAGVFDLWLGDVFLRNVYSVYDFGDTDPKTGKAGDPYMKLLTITDQTAALADFTVSRPKSLAALPPLGDLNAALAADKKASPTSSSGAGGSKTGNLAAGTDDSNSAIAQSVDKLVNLAPAMLGLLGLNAFALLVLVALGVALLRKGKKDTGVSAPRYQPVHLPPRKGDAHTGYDEPHYEEHRYTDA